MHQPAKSMMPSPDECAGAPGVRLLVACGAFITLAWCCTGAFLYVAVLAQQKRSVGAELPYLLLVSIPPWTAAIAAALYGAYRAGWTLRWLLWVSLSVASPAIVFSGSLVPIARWCVGQ